MHEGSGRLYLDHAATSFPKAPGVAEAMVEVLTRHGATSGRGHYAEAVRGAEIVMECRRRLARLLGCSAPENIIFTLNTTDALNLAIQGLVRRRLRRHPRRAVHLITSAMDHNSVLRPFNALAGRVTANDESDISSGVAGEEGLVSWTCLPADPRTGRIEPADLAAAIRPQTALVALVHASNVAGTIQPVAEFGRICRSAGVPLLIDAAQSAGHVPIDMARDGIDLLAFPGHKGLLGPLGTGGLAIRPGLESHIDPVRQGGTGSRSEMDVQPAEMPDRFESGSLNAVGIAGLSAAVKWMLEQGPKSLREHELALLEAALSQLPAAEQAGLRLLGPPLAGARVGILTFIHDFLPARRLAGELERRFGVLARSGLHCAPRAHAAMRTSHCGGTPDEAGGVAGTDGGLRLSFGPFVTLEQIEQAMDGLIQIAGAGRAAPVLRSREHGCNTAKR